MDSVGSSVIVVSMGVRGAEKVHITWEHIRYHNCNHSFLLMLHLPNRKDPHPATYKFIDAVDIPRNLAEQKHVK